MRWMSTLWLLMVVTLLAVPSSGAAENPSPTAQVRETVDQVLDVLRNSGLEGDARRQELSRLVRARFEFSIMSQRTLGKFWQSASLEEQQRFVGLFTDLLEASYIGRVEAYSDEQVLYAGERLAGDRAEVATRVRNASGDIPIDYRLVLIGGQWLVYDVIVEDVSLIKNYRSSYAEIVRSEGFAGLFARMEEKIRKLRAPPTRNG